MTAREQMKTEILQAARVAELRRLAEDTAEAYEQALARSGMTPNDCPHARQKSAAE